MPLSLEPLPPARESDWASRLASGNRTWQKGTPTNRQHQQKPGGRREAGALPPLAACPGCPSSELQLPTHSGDTLPVWPISPQLLPWAGFLGEIKMSVNVLHYHVCPGNSRGVRAQQGCERWVCGGALGMSPRRQGTPSHPSVFGLSYSGDTLTLAVCRESWTLGATPKGRDPGAVAGWNSPGPPASRTPLPTFRVPGLRSTARTHGSRSPREPVWQKAAESAAASGSLRFLRWKSLRCSQTKCPLSP